jgi:hypothetical protein
MSREPFGTFSPINALASIRSERSACCGRFSSTSGGLVRMTEFSELAPRERAKRYRQLAQDAEKLAGQSKDRIRESYLIMAEQWRKLADEVEGDLK